MSQSDELTRSTPFTLSNEQVRALQLHHLNLTRRVIGMLDGNFRLRYEEHSNWPMLGQHMIDLLNTMDSDAYRDICHGMVSTMVQEVSSDVPFVAASMAEAGLTDNDIFTKILARLLSSTFAFFAAGRVA